jgi:hypothetical protein
MNKKKLYVFALVISFIITVYMGIQLIGLMLGSILLAISGLLFFEAYERIKFLKSSETRERKGLAS